LEQLFESKGDLITFTVTIGRNQLRNHGHSQWTARLIPSPFPCTVDSVAKSTYTFDSYQQFSRSDKSLSETDLPSLSPLNQAPEVIFQIRLCVEIILDTLPDLTIQFLIRFQYHGNWLSTRVSLSNSENLINFNRSLAEAQGISPIPALQG
jgi:hypothetical protein